MDRAPSHGGVQTFTLESYENDFTNLVTFYFEFCFHCEKRPKYVAKLTTYSYNKLSENAII